LIVREYFGYMDRRLTDHGFSGPSVEAATLSDRAGVDSETGNSIRVATVRTLKP
jgi:hypothetical protein